MDALDARRFDDASAITPRRMAAGAAIALALAGYVFLATLILLIFPKAAPALLAPFAIIIVAAAPTRRAAPMAAIRPLLLLGAGTIVFWPTYIHLALGPLPILTPPRLILYGVSAMWIYDMTVSPMRRAWLVAALRRRRWLAGSVLVFFALNAASLPLAEGRQLAATAFFRVAIIHLIPFLVFVTYVRDWRFLRMLLAAATAGACAAGFIACVEASTGTLLATKLSPFIPADAEWLRIAQEAKVRDGVFRAQATHTHPISLGEYLAIFAPLALAFTVKATNALARTAWGFGLAFTIAGIVATSSRGAMIASMAAFAIWGAWTLIKIARSSRAARLQPLIAFCLLGAILSAGPVYLAARATASGADGSSAARSSQARLDQISIAWPKIMRRPVLGYGTGRAAVIVGFWGRTLTLDNYYLTVAVDLGLPGPIVFAALLGFAIRASAQTGATGPPAIRLVAAAFAIGLAAFAISRSVNSQMLNFNALYPLLGALVGAGLSREETRASPRSAARRAHPYW